jgi:regulatory protein
MKPRGRFEPPKAVDCNWIDAMAERSSSESACMRAALRLLTRREHTTWELTQKLSQRGFAAEDIEPVIAACVRLNYLNDGRAGRLLVEQLARKGLGHLRIRMEFKKRGICDRLTDAILNAEFTETEERRAARRVLQKKMPAYDSEPDSRKRKEKLFRFLLSRGFSAELARDLLRNIR